MILRYCPPCQVGSKKYQAHENDEELEGESYGEDRTDEEHDKY